jgi:hypothetical protein
LKEDSVYPVFVKGKKDKRSDFARNKKQESQLWDRRKVLPVWTNDTNFILTTLKMPVLTAMMFLKHEIYLNDIKQVDCNTVIKFV